MTHGERREMEARMKQMVGRMIEAGLSDAESAERMDAAIKLAYTHKPVGKQGSMYLWGKTGVDN